MPIAKVNDIELYYDEYGSGDNIVITASEGEFRHPHLDEFPYYLAEEGYHLYTVTLRGHWKSTHVFEDYGKEWYNIWSDDVYEFGKLVSSGRRFTYAGISHGSGVGWHLADRHPEILKCFVAIVCGPHYLNGDLNEQQTSFAREKTIAAADDPALREDLIRFMEPDWKTIPTEKLIEKRREYEVWAQEMREMAPEELRIRPRIAFAWISTEEELVEKLKTIRVPMLMIAATNDSIIDPRAMFRSACAVPHAKTIFYQGAEHSLATRGEYIDDVRDEILLYLERRTKGDGYRETDY